jgi:fatty-acyl-CoA synthase
MGNEVGAHGTGELILRGATVMKEYWRKPETTSEALRGGWLPTGDVATIDADGYITLVDRLKVNPLPGHTVTLDEIREFGAESLAAYKLPRELVIRAIPRNPSGKILATAPDRRYRRRPGATSPAMRRHP